MGGVAISCTTCAVRGKQRSGTGDPGKRAENQSLNLLSSFHRFLSLSLSLSLDPRSRKRNTRPSRKYIVVSDGLIIEINDNTEIERRSIADPSRRFVDETRRNGMEKRREIIDRN